MLRSARHLPKLLGRPGLQGLGVAPALGVAVILGGPGAEAAHLPRGLCLHLLLALGEGVVVDVVVVDVLCCLLGHEALGSEEGAPGLRGGRGGQLAPRWEQGVVLLVAVVVVVGGTGAGAVAAHAGRLAAGGLEDPRQVVVQNGLWVLLIAAGGQEGEGVRRGPPLPGAQC